MGSQSLLLSMDLKFLIMMTRLQTLLLLTTIISSNLQTTVMFCGLVIFIKNFNFINGGGLGHPFWFHIFSAWPFLDSWLYLFYTRDVLVRISFLLLFLIFLLKFCFVTTLCGVLANVAVDYFRPTNRHSNTILIHILNYHAYLL